jgi:hypothetical protein
VFIPWLKAETGNIIKARNSEINPGKSEMAAWSPLLDKERPGVVEARATTPGSLLGEKGSHFHGNGAMNDEAGADSKAPIHIKMCTSLQIEGCAG